MTDLILASASPRRSEILQQIGVDFQIVPANIDETPISQESPVDYVQRMAKEKAQHVINTIADSSTPVLGADTSVVLKSKIYGKPTNQEDGMAMLAALPGNTHQVLSAVAIGNKQHCMLRLSSTDVKFRDSDLKECFKYWNTGDSQMKKFEEINYKTVEVRNYKQLKDFIKEIDLKKVLSL